MLFAPLEGWRPGGSPKGGPKPIGRRSVRKLVDEDSLVGPDSAGDGPPNTHQPSDEAFDPTEARRSAERLEIHFLAVG